MEEIPERCSPEMFFAVVEVFAMDGLKNALRSDPRVERRLQHARDAAAAEAAIRFFAQRDPSANVGWYGCETWRQIMEVFTELAPTSDPTWQLADNNDNGSLRTGEHRLRVGQVIEIEGLPQPRYVTSTMGGPGNFHACFKNQRAVPLGRVRWRVIASADPSTAPVPEPPHARSPHTDPSAPASPAQKTRWAAFIKGLREHPIVAAMVFVGAAIIGIASFTESVEKLIQLFSRYFHP